MSRWSWLAVQIPGLHGHLRRYHSPRICRHTCRPSGETSVIDTKILLRTLFTSDVLKIRFKIELVVWLATAAALIALRIQGTSVRFDGEKAVLVSGCSTNYYPDIRQIIWPPHPLRRVMKNDLMMFARWKRGNEDDLEDYLNVADLAEPSYCKSALYI